MGSSEENLYDLDVQITDLDAKMAGNDANGTQCRCALTFERHCSEFCPESDEIYPRGL